MEKTCFKCARRLPLEQFYRHPAMADGRLGKCKGCAKQDVRENYSATREQKREYDRTRCRTPERKESLRRSRTSSRTRRPDKYAAQLMAKAAVESGFLRRLPCAVCGDERTDGHHENYSKPLDLVWLCRTHHMRRHAELREQGIEL
jgi:hypothetical protein